MNISGTNFPASYDVANRLVSVGYGNTIAYSYAPGNKRVWRGLWTSGSLTTDEVTFWSVTGQKLATYSLSMGTSNQACYPNYWQMCFVSTVTASQTGTNYYFGRKLIKNAGGYVGADRLGSIGKFYPYGQEKPSATTNGTEKFTGYFRDAETGLDYADQRFHNPGTGRFMTPDNSGVAIAPMNPASWNRYAYGAGDPIRYKDPSGLEVCDPEEGDCGSQGCAVGNPFAPNPGDPACEDGGDEPQKPSQPIETCQQHVADWLPTDPGQIAAVQRVLNENGYTYLLGKNGPHATYGTDGAPNGTLSRDEVYQTDLYIFSVLFNQVVTTVALVTGERRRA